jgi:hypothetical protein
VELCVDFDPITSFGRIFEPNGFAFDVSWEIVFLSFGDNNALIDVSREGEWDGCQFVGFESLTYVTLLRALKPNVGG